MSSDLVVITPKSIEEAERLSKTLSVSQLLPEALRQKPADVLATLLAGAELGLAPMQSIRGIQIIKGKPTLAADTLGALVKRRSEICEYLVLKESTDTKATYETKRRGDPQPTTLSFSIQDAQRAGLNGDNWRKYPAAMLRARALSAIARAVFPDLCLGVYDPEELAAEPSPPPPTVERDVTPPAATPVASFPKKSAEVKAALAAQLGTVDAQVVKTEPKPEPAMPFDRIMQMGRDAGFSDKEIGAKVRELTGGKSKRSELKDEDAAKFRAWLEDMPTPPSDPEPPPAAFEESVTPF